MVNQFGSPGEVIRQPPAFRQMPAILALVGLAELRIKPRRIVGNRLKQILFKINYICTVFGDTNIEFVSRLKSILNAKHNLYLKALKVFRLL